MKKSRFGRLRFRFGLAKIAFLKATKKVVTKLKERRKVVFNPEKALRVVDRYDRLPNNPDRQKIMETIESQFNENGFLRLCVFVCPKFDTKALFSKSPERYMPVEAGPDLFEPRIQKIQSLRQDLMKAGLPSEVNVIIGDNDAEEYIFPFIEKFSFDANVYRQRQTLYRASFEERCRREFGDKIIVWSLAESGIVQDVTDPIISDEAMRKEITFFNWLFSAQGPYKDNLNFSEEAISKMVCMKYKLYGSQGKFLEAIGGILLQTEGPGVWLERTDMLRCTGSPAIPAIYPWIRKDEEIGK